VFNIKVILNCFELSSDLKVNFLKSRIGGVEVDQSVIQRFPAIINCSAMNTTFKYLGMLVRGCQKRGVLWIGVIERIKSKLDRWKGKFISMVVRICLIKFVLSYILLFYVSLYKMSSLVLKEIVKLQRNFLWGWGFKREEDCLDFLEKCL